MELFSHLSALGFNYMCKSTEIIMNGIIKCAIMGELQKCECKSLTKVFSDFWFPLYVSHTMEEINVFSKNLLREPVMVHCL